MDGDAADFTWQKIISLMFPSDDVQTKVPYEIWTYSIPIVPSESR